MSVTNNAVNSTAKSDLATSIANLETRIKAHVTGELGVLTKSDVGLSNVQNFATADQSDAENGTRTDRYVTPLRTVQSIDKFRPSLFGDSTKFFTLYENASGNHGGTGPYSGWTERNVSGLSNPNSYGASIGASQGTGNLFTIPAGKWLIEGWMVTCLKGVYNWRIVRASDDVVLLTASTVYYTDTANDTILLNTMVPVENFINLASATEVYLEHICTADGSSAGYSEGKGKSGTDSRRLQLTFWECKAG